MAASGRHPTRDLLKTIELFPKHDTVTSIVGDAKLLLLKKLYKIPWESSWLSLLLAKVWLKVNSSQALFV